MQGRWTEEELKIIKDVFKDEGFVLAVRNVMLGLTDIFEHKTTDKVLGIIKKNLIPQYEPNIPLGKQQDLCALSLDYIKGFNSEEGIKRVEAYDIALDYIERRLGVLSGEEDKGETLKDLKSGENRFVRMLAYLQVASYVENSLMQLVLIAGEKELTAEDIELRQKKDSSK